MKLFGKKNTVSVDEVNNDQTAEATTPTTVNNGTLRVILTVLKYIIAAVLGWLGGDVVF